MSVSWFEQSQLQRHLLRKSQCYEIQYICGSIGSATLDIKDSYFVHLSLGKDGNSVIDYGDGIKVSTHRKLEFMLSPPIGFVQYVFQGSIRGIRCEISRATIERFFEFASVPAHRLEEVSFRGLRDPALLPMMQSTIEEQLVDVVYDDQLFRDTALSYGIASRLLHVLHPAKHARTLRVDLSLNDLRHIEEFVIGHLEVGFDVDDLAACVRKNEAELTFAFKNLLGKGPMAWVRDVRARRAFQLVEKSKTSLGEIAYKCGYSGQSHMNSDFRVRFDKTPGQIRLET